MSALFVKHLTVLDFSYAHATRGILGESWIVDVELHGDLDEHLQEYFDDGWSILSVSSFGNYHDNETRGWVTVALERD